MAPAKGSKNTKTSKREVVPPKCLQDNNMHLDSDTEMDSDNQSEMSQSLFKDTKTKVIKKKGPISNKRTRAEKFPICILKKNKHHRIEIHNNQDQDTEEAEQDAQMATSDIEISIEKVHPVYTIANKIANPPPPGSGENSESDALAALGLTPIKTHKAQRSPTKSPKSTTGN